MEGARRPATGIPPRVGRLASAAGVTFAAVAVAACSGNTGGTARSGGAGGAPGGQRAGWRIALPVVTMPPFPTTTVDPGTLPQTKDLPPASGPRFDQEVEALWRAIVDGDPTEALPFFFPLSAYIQVKGISDPVHDYDTRLIPAFESDIESLHADLGGGAGSARLVSLDVPAGAQWILPGTEYNKGSYWRVFGSRLRYEVGGEQKSFPIYSLISWRGQWYVVHIGPPTQ